MLAAYTASSQESSDNQPDHLQAEQQPTTGTVIIAEPDAYAQQLDAALREGRDIWGEALIAEGGATYDNIMDQLRPMFHSTGHVYSEKGVHNLLFGEDGGEPPYIIPLADGSRIAANQYQSEDYIAWYVYEEEEPLGSDLERLEGPTLAESWLPVLETAYTDAAGNRYTQTAFAGHHPGHEGLVAFIRMQVSVPQEGERAHLTARFGDDAGSRFYHATPDGSPSELHDDGARHWQFGPGEHILYAIWSPESPPKGDLEVSKDQFHAAYAAMKAYWTEKLAPVLRFDVPEPHVMDVQRNLLIQNLIMRWRYSLGAVVYHGSFYQPESSDTVQTLGEFGHSDAYRDGLVALLDMTKGKDYYINWERAEKLTHGAHYYYLTRDADFIHEHTGAYVALCEEFQTQMDADPHGLLMKQRQSGDIPDAEYFVFHQTLCWRGMRDMAEVWQEVGRDDLFETWRPVAVRLKTALDTAMKTTTKDLKDGSLFVQRAFYLDEPPYPSITETKLGSYWNLVMPYGFASGYWPMDGPEIGRILDYMHGHGSTFLGLLRFNYYPTPIGAYRADGIPGYDTTGVDNVYLPSYIRMLAAQDQADRQVLTFYGKLAHGMTRNTYVSGEGATLGARPGEFYRSCYGTPSSANNTAFLLNLRLMLVRESFNRETGAPEGLFLAHATPRDWLEDGKIIKVSDAPTSFGPVSYLIESRLAENRVNITVTLPERNPFCTAHLKLRLPKPYRIADVKADDASVPFDAATGKIHVSNASGTLELNVLLDDTPAR